MFKALKEIKGSQSGLYDKYGSEEAFRESFQQIEGEEARLPKYEDVYGHMRTSWNNLRNIYFIKTQQEMEIGVGEEYKLDERRDGR